MALERSEASYSELESLSLEAKQALRGIKEEVRGQKVDKSRPILERAQENFAFIQRLRNLGPVNEYLRKSGRYARIFRLVPIVDRRGLSVNHSGIVESRAFAKPSPSTSYDYEHTQYTHGDIHMRDAAHRSLAKGLANLKKEQVVGKFESATRLAWIRLPF